MSGLSITPARTTEAHSPAPHRDNQGTIWIGSFPPQMPLRLPEPPRHGCSVIRRITDDLGREWRVRQLWSENCHGLLFQCAVRGVRSEVRPMRGPLESLTDNELLIALAPADD